MMATMTKREPGKLIPGDSQAAVELLAVRAGDVDAIRRLLNDDPAGLLVARGARVDKAWHAAALGMLGRLEAILGTDPPSEDVSQAFWHACAAGQRRGAEYLLSRGADLNWEPDYAHGMPLDNASGLSTQQENVVSSLRELEARSADAETS